MQVLLLAIVMMLTVKCNGPGDSPMAQVIELSDKDNGQAVTLPLGSELDLALEANPTTGYGWEVMADGAPQLVLSEQIYEMSPAAQELDGAGGTARWRFKAAAAGATELRLEYKRGWEKDQPPAHTYVLHIVVEAAAVK